MKRLKIKKFYTPIIIIVVLVLIISAFYLYQKNRENSLILSSNIKIEKAFEDFRNFAEENQNEKLCKNGLINEDNFKLKKISEEIIKNRIIDVETKEYAKNQTDVDISCLQSFDKWVLFSSLNEHKNDNGRSFYCTDSSGEKGFLNFDVELINCSR